MFCALPLLDSKTWTTLTQMSKIPTKTFKATWKNERKYTKDMDVRKNQSRSITHEI